MTTKNEIRDIITRHIFPDRGTKNYHSGPDERIATAAEAIAEMFNDTLFVGQPFLNKGYYAVLGKDVLRTVRSTDEHWRCWNQDEGLCCDTLASDPCEHIRAVIEWCAREQP